MPKYGFNKNEIIQYEISEIDKDGFRNEYTTKKAFTPSGGGDTNVISPAQFGAKGDGITDDTVALSQAFNHSDAVIEGGNLYYKILELEMVESKNLVIRNFHFYKGIQMILKHCENIIFENCVWDTFNDNGIIDKNVHCVILSTIHTGADEWTEANNWHIDEVCKDITFTNCQFIATHFTESTPSMYEGNSRPHYNTGMCIRLNGVDKLKVRGCYFTQNWGNACVQSNTFAPLGDFEFTNNLFYLNGWGGIELYRYTGISSYPSRIIQGNRFIGHGLGYLPKEYLDLIGEEWSGVGTAVLLGGNVVRIGNEPAHCAVVDNYFEDNNESSVEGWQWNPVKNNVILGNGVLQSEESVAEMKAKYKIDYPLYVRKNPSQNPIYMHAPTGSAQYMNGEVRSIENNTVGRMYITRNPIMIRGDYYEQLVVRNNTFTDDALYSNKNAKYIHLLGAKFKKGIIWENNIGLKPYFNECSFDDGEYLLDDILDVYKCAFTSKAFESISKTNRFQQLKSARFSEEFATLRDNTVSELENGKPVLGHKAKEIETVMPEPVWDIKDQSGYANGYYTFGGETNPTVLDTNLALGETDTNWTIFVNAMCTGDNDAGNNTYLIKLITFSDNSNNLSLELGSRYSGQPWTYFFRNGRTSYDGADTLDGSGAKRYLAVDSTSAIVLRHVAGSGVIEAFAARSVTTPAAISEIKCGSYSFTSGTAGTLRFGGSSLTMSQTKAFFNGKIFDAAVYDKALSDSEVSLVMLGRDIAPHSDPVAIYDISTDSRYVAGTGVTFDGTFAIDTSIPLLENANDFTLITQFKFDNMGANGGYPNFTFIPVFSAMSAEMPDEVHTGYTDKGICIGLSMQNGRDLTATATGGFIMFRRDWRYTNSISIDMYNYNSYFNYVYTVVVIRKNGVMKIYDQSMTEIMTLTGEYANAILSGNLTIGARMGYGSGYNTFFKGIISEFKVYNSALNLIDIEADHPSVYDNDASEKGAVTYHLSNKNNTRDSVRYALVEIDYDLGEYNSAEYTQQYPKAFAIKMDKIYKDLIWVPCSSSKHAIFCEPCKWDAIYDAYDEWNIEIINPGTVPNMHLKINGIKVLLLSHESAIPATVDATDFNITWSNNDRHVGVGEDLTGYIQYVPDDTTTGTELTVWTEDETVASATGSESGVTVTGVNAGETVLHVSIPYGTEHTYAITVV